MLRGYQIKALWQRLFEIHELIRTKNHTQLKRTAGMTDEVIEEAEWEINEYPGQMTECPFDGFSDAVIVGDFVDGFKVDALAKLWFDGEESDLSMECIVEFKNAREIKRVTVERVHVF